MSRMSISAFLTKAKQALSTSIRSKGDQPASFVIGNQSADLDSITCALVYGYIKSSTPEARKTEKCLIPITNIPSSELRLRPELTALLKHANVKPSDLITLDDLENLHRSLPADKTDWTLVDHNVLLGELGEHFSNRVRGVVDHHDDEGKVPQDAEPRIIEKTGSCNSHVVNHLRETWDSISTSNAADGPTPDATTLNPREIDAQIATLALGSILIDTVDLKAEHKVTKHDEKAVDYLERKIKASSSHSDYDRETFFNEINNAKSNLDDLNLEEILRKDYKQWDEAKLSLGISSCVKSVEYLMQQKSTKTRLVKALLEFAKERKVDLYAIMTAHNESDSGFVRQLLLLAVEEGKAVEAADKFVKDNGKELDLEECEIELDEAEEKVKWLKFWKQGNLDASRKQVAPMLREAMG